MGSLISYAMTVFMGFFAIMNPFANAPIFMGLMDGASEETKKKVALKSTVTAFIIVLVFTLLGKYIFSLFGITIMAFKIAGGILIFYVGFEMLMSKKPKVKHNNATENGIPEPANDDDKSGIAISPLAIPLLSGPGTIVTAMNYTTKAANDLQVGIMLFMFAIMLVLTYLAFVLGDLLVKKVGKNFIAIIGKLMGLILSIIGTDMIIEGLKIAFM